MDKLRFHRGLITATVAGWGLVLVLMWLSASGRLGVLDDRSALLMLGFSLLLLFSVGIGAVISLVLILRYANLSRLHLYAAIAVGLALAALTRSVSGLQAGFLLVALWLAGSTLWKMWFRPGELVCET